VSLEEEIADWAQSRPTWQRAVLRRLASGDALTDESNASDLPTRPSDGRCVRLVSLEPVAHVNALLVGQRLTFGKQGLTVAYGDNASGKSGFARLIKQIVRARHQQDILSNVFLDRGDETPAALVSFEVGDEEHTDEWPGRMTHELGQIAFYDEACGESYITTESEVTYRPSMLYFFDGLIAACDGVRKVLDGLIAANTQSRERLPAVIPGSPIGSFLATLAPETTAEQIDAACALPTEADLEIASLAEEEARLPRSDPGTERARLVAIASKLDSPSSSLRTTLAWRWWLRGLKTCRLWPHLPIPAATSSKGTSWPAPCVLPNCPAGWPNTSPSSLRAEVRRLGRTRPQIHPRHCPEEGRVGALRAQPLRVVPSSDQQAGGGVGATPGIAIRSGAVMLSGWRRWAARRVIWASRSPMRVASPDN
jgi:hypothetical protein